MSKFLDNHFGLKDDHKELFYRVMTKAVFFSALGLSLIFTPPFDQGPSTTENILLLIISLQQWGWIFLTLGVSIFIGAYHTRTNDYKLLRYALSVAVAICITWLLALLYIQFFSDAHTSTAIIILWSYLTFNVTRVNIDPGFRTVAIRKEINKNDS